MRSIKLKPAPGCKVPMPERGNRLLADDGEMVPLSDYWLRRLNHGDVVDATPKVVPLVAVPTKSATTP